MRTVMCTGNMLVSMRPTFLLRLASIVLVITHSGGPEGSVCDDILLQVT